MTNGFWDNYDQATQEESGGGGIVGKVRIDMGFKVYVGGVDQGATFFPVTTPADKSKVKTEAQAFATKSGAPRNPQWGIQIKVFRAGAYSAGQPVTWQNDRYFNADAWTSAAKELVVPKLKQLDISLPWEGWARIGFAPDPYEVQAGQMKDVDQAGNPRFTPRAYVTAIFANEEEAVAAVGTSGTDVAETIPFDQPAFAIPMPDGWDAETWGDVVEDLKAQTGAPKEVVDYAAATYGVTITLGDVVKLRR